jgi:hypothetical protein
LRAIEADLSAHRNNDAYVYASRVLRTERREALDRRRTFKNTDIIDVTGVSKELTAEILAIAITSGKSVCSLSWKERIVKKRKLIGIDSHVYFDMMKSNIVLDIYRAQRAVWMMFYILSAILFSFVFVYAANFFGYDVVSDRAINVLALLTGIGGLFLSYVALNLVPIRSSADRE